MVSSVKLKPLDHFSNSQTPDIKSEGKSKRIWAFTFHYEGKETKRRRKYYTNWIRDLKEKKVHLQTNQRNDDINQSIQQMCRSENPSRNSKPSRERTTRVVWFHPFQSLIKILRVRFWIINCNTRIQHHLLLIIIIMISSDSESEFSPKHLPHCTAAPAAGSRVAPA